MNSLFLTVMMSASAATPAQPPVPPPALSPLLYVKVIGPTGMKVTFHPGTPAARTLDAPAVVGVRPGYVYRLELSLPQYPNLKLYPSLEVRGALQTSIAQAMRHPVPVIFSADEIRRIDRVGSMITKVYYLEDPAQAPPIATTPDEPLVVDVPGETDPLQEARLHGRIMLVARVGEREPGRDDLVRLAVPNTILFPGEVRLVLPPAPPQVPWIHAPVYDPIAGPRHSDEECLPDGGDTGPRIGIDPEGKLGGLNASDTAIEYTTDSGKRRVATSNRVCVLVPRYAVARQEQTPVGQATAVGPYNTISTKTSIALNDRSHAQADIGIKSLSGVNSRLSASEVDGKVRLNGFENTQGVRIVGMIEGVKTIGVVKEPMEITAYPFCEPISLFKWSDPKEAQVGDVVTFYLRYHNHTKQSVDSLAISDSLTARLQYMPGSARSDREATLTVQGNEVGSVVLRWDLTGKLPPGETGVVAFQARVR